MYKGTDVLVGLFSKQWISIRNALQSSKSWWVWIIVSGGVHWTIATHFVVMFRKLINPTGCGGLLPKLVLRFSICLFFPFRCNFYVLKVSPAGVCLLLLWNAVDTVLHLLIFIAGCGFGDHYPKCLWGFKRDAYVVPVSDFSELVGNARYVQNDSCMLFSCILSACSVLHVLIYPRC